MFASLLYPSLIAFAVAPLVAGCTVAARLDQAGTTSTDSPDESSAGESSLGPGETGGEMSSTTGAENICIPGVGDCPDGEKCQPYVEEDGACCVDADMCVPITGNRQYGEPCTRERYGDDCAKDLFCHAGTSGKEGPGQCEQLCDRSDLNSCIPLLGDGSVCLPDNHDVWPLCYIPCHPVRPHCSDGEGCYPGWMDYFLCAPPDVVPGKGSDGDSCYTPGGCNPGLACHPAQSRDGCDAESCCTPYCDIGSESSPCSDPESCVLLFEPNDPEVEPSLYDVGVCSVVEEQD